MSPLVFFYTLVGFPYSAVISSVLFSMILVFPLRPAFPDFTPGEGKAANTAMSGMCACFRFDVEARRDERSFFFSSRGRGLVARRPLDGSSIGGWVAGDVDADERIAF